MKNPQQTILILLALGLCGLCAWQWHGQVHQYQQSARLQQTIYDQSQAIMGHTNSIRVMDQQIAHMDARITELNEMTKSSRVTIATLQQDNATLSNLVAQYKTAVAAQQDHLRQANDNIRRQNEALKELVAQRDSFVTKLNDSIRERNEIVAQYNALVQRLQELQATATNRPASPPQK